MTATSEILQASEFVERCLLDYVQRGVPLPTKVTLPSSLPAPFPHLALRCGEQGCGAHIGDAYGTVYDRPGAVLFATHLRLIFKGEEDDLIAEAVEKALAILGSTTVRYARDVVVAGLESTDVKAGSTAAAVSALRAGAFFVEKTATGSSASIQIVEANWTNVSVSSECPRHGHRDAKADDVREMLHAISAGRARSRVFPCARAL